MAAFGANNNFGKFCHFWPPKWSFFRSSKYANFGHGFWGAFGAKPFFCEFWHFWLSKWKIWFPPPKYANAAHFGQWETSKWLLGEFWGNIFFLQILAFLPQNGHFWPSQIYKVWSWETPKWLWAAFGAKKKGFLQILPFFIPQMGLFRPLKNANFDHTGQLR